MPSSKKVKLFDPKRLSPEEREFAESMLKYIQEGSGNSEQEEEFLNPPGSGLYGTGGSTIDINYDQSTNER